MNFLLDTNAWLRLFQFPGEITTEVRRRLNGEDVLGLSPFSLIEIAQKNAKAPDKLGLSLDVDAWFQVAMPRNRVRLVPITPAIAAKAYDLSPDFHGDPADRVITATAIMENLTLVTSDKLLIEFDLVTTLSTR